MFRDRGLGHGSDPRLRWAGFNFQVLGFEVRGLGFGVWGTGSPGDGFGV